jgi:cell division septal protein FtsQ
VSVFEPSPRFLRPVDLRATRRNHRRLQAQKLLKWTANVALVLLLCAAAAWIWDRTHRDDRFAVSQLEVVGITHTPAPSVRSILDRYSGANLFRLDISRLQQEMQMLPWIASVAIEKELPSTLRIHVAERTPVALVERKGTLSYADSTGRVFAQLTPEVGNAELPLIRDAKASEIVRTIAFVEKLRRTRADLYTRISEIEPVAPDGFRIFDRDLAVPVLVRERDAEEKWTALYRIASAERFQRADLEYADLRFDRRIVLKPRRIAPAPPAATQPIVN